MREARRRWGQSQLSTNRRSRKCPRTTRRNAFRQCSMVPNPHHRVGAWFSQVHSRRTSAKVDARRRKLPNGIGPEEAVPARMTRDARGRARPREAPPATRRGGSASGAFRATGSQRRESLSGKMHRCSRSTEADAPHRASPPPGPPARTAGPAVKPPIELRNCLIAATARNEGARSKR